MKDNHEHSHCYACGFQFKPDEWSTYITIKGEIDSALIHDDCLEILRHGMWKDKPLFELGHKIWIDDGREPESMQCGITSANNTYPEPSTEAKLWVIDRIAQFICDTEGEGTFRKLIYEYLKPTDLELRIRKEVMADLDKMIACEADEEEYYKGKLLKIKGRLNLLWGAQYGCQ